MARRETDAATYPVAEDAASAIVFAFDRDHTVDVNPPTGDRAAVPLAWIRHLAHRTDHVVFATGNQRLKDEAEIPGTAEIRREHPDLAMENDEDDQLFPRRLNRRDRVRSLGDLYPAATQRIVVDDVDLSDLEGWTHFFPWNFYAAVQAGTILRDVGLEIE